MADDAELTRLRRVAYSRTGTPDDLRRLAELEGQSASDADVPIPRAETAPESELVPEPAPPSEPASPAVSGSRRPLLIAALVGVVVGAAATALVGVAIDRAQPVSDGASALAIFDTAAEDVDDPATLSLPLDQIVPGYLDDLELRMLGEGLGWRAYALRGSTFRLTQICLLIDTGRVVSSGCAAEEDFAERGLMLGTGDATFRWGPDGTALWIEAAGS